MVASGTASFLDALWFITHTRTATLTQHITTLSSVRQKALCPLCDGCTVVHHHHSISLSLLFSAHSLLSPTHSEWAQYQHNSIRYYIRTYRYGVRNIDIPARLTNAPHASSKALSTPSCTLFCVEYALLRSINHIIHILPFQYFPSHAPTTRSAHLLSRLTANSTQSLRIVPTIATIRYFSSQTSFLHPSIIYGC